MTPKFVFAFVHNLGRCCHYLPKCRLNDHSIGGVKISHDLLSIKAGKVRGVLHDPFQNFCFAPVADDIPVSPSRRDGRRDAPRHSTATQNNCVRRREGHASVHHFRRRQDKRLTWRRCQLIFDVFFFLSASPRVLLILCILLSSLCGPNNSMLNFGLKYFFVLAPFPPSTS